MQLPAKRTPAMRGFTLVEVTVALALLATALTLLVSSMLSLTHARQVSQERHQVTTAMSRAVETLQALGPTGALVAYAPAPGGEPFPAAGSGSGAPFFVPTVQGDDGQPLSIEIEFELDETTNDPAIGLPRDLDADGSISNGNVGELGPDGEILASILPLRLRADWRSFDGRIRSLSWTAVIVEN
jgi:prepilin-type N-terminal cleavage/methylation domain-containing protein